MRLLCHNVKIIGNDAHVCFGGSLRTELAVLVTGIAPIGPVGTGLHFI